MSKVLGKKKIHTSPFSLISENPYISGTACWAVQGPSERIEEAEGPQQCGELCDACYMGLSHLEVAGKETNKQTNKK